MNEDRDSELKAIKLLDNRLSGAGEFPEKSGIEKEKLISMYFESRDTVRQNSDDFKLSRAAVSLLATCIRVVRCSGVIGEQEKELLINSKTYSPETKSLYDHALRLHSEFRALQKNSRDTHF
jgi:hypothetical protein